jgi:hypothetical protein
MIVAIQVVRLQYYEFFSKFFVETGVEFAPFRFRKGAADEADKVDNTQGPQVHRAADNRVVTVHPTDCDRVEYLFVLFRLWFKWHVRAFRLN